MTSIAEKGRGKQLREADRWTGNRKNEDKRRKAPIESVSSLLAHAIAAIAQIYQVSHTTPQYHIIMVSWKTSIQPARARSESPGQEEYTVERILDVRADRDTGRHLYYVKWQGYIDNESTWEPEENLERAEDLIQAFWAARQGGAGGSGGGGQNQNQNQSQTQN